MKLLKTATHNKKYLALAVITTAMSVLFSLMSAPFLRVLASTKAKLFWLFGLVLVSALFVFQFQIVAVYVGAIWMTLGLYSQLEQLGMGWKKTSFLSILAGVLYSVVSVYAITIHSAESQIIKHMTEPILQTLKQVLPEEKFEAQAILVFLPGLMAASLISTLATAFVFESRVSGLFNIRREKVASGLKWLEFRLPDSFMWVTLFSLLFSIVETPIKLVQVASINLAIISVVAYFFQGLATVEFAMRFYRFGRITKLLIYFLILTWALPFVAAVGFADYWIDVRTRLRTQLKSNKNI